MYISEEQPAATEELDPNQTLESEPQEQQPQQSGFFSNFSSMMGKVANSASTVIKDKVSSTSMIAEFNKEQEEFIKNKGKEMMIFFSSFISLIFVNFGMPF